MGMSSPVERDASVFIFE